MRILIVCVISCVVVTVYSASIATNKLQTFGEKCTKDGYFYKDENSYIICRSGKATVQDCARGTSMKVIDPWFFRDDRLGILQICGKNKMAEEQKEKQLDDHEEVVEDHFDDDDER